ncbi:AsmA-like C-terminal region-containing protein [Negadavirga shengliensis]|uniref:AsmA-like C-terminal region-containing protein n=1 Tax=Negadavirga shengliensis TaxID=1389218 RepID=A0ABV9SXV1_9BACT
MKKFAFTIFVILALLLVAMVAVPFIFKDKILAKIDQEIASTVNAQVYYDYDQISLSVFRRFPNIAATVREFGIRGNPPFQNDTLVHVGSLQVDFNLWSVIFDDYPTLTGIHLNDGSMYIKVLEDGTANYDIMYESNSEEVSTEPSEFRMGVDVIEVNRLSFIYDDRETDFFMALSDMDLAGRADFTLDVYDLLAKGRGNIVMMSHEGTEYLTNKVITLDSKINVDLEKMVFGFENASLALNDFGFGLDGHVAMPTEDIEMDIRFYGEDNTFKSVLSLVPGIYTDSFQGLRTSGEMDFSGFVKGIYNETSFPAFQLGLTINEGMFQYPDLPRPVQQVNMDLLIKNETGNIDYTEINLSRFSLQFGDQPFSGRFYLKDLVHYDMDAQLKGNLDLKELTAIFPLEDLELRGGLALDAVAKGRYDSVNNIIPALNATINLSNGYIKSVEYPAPIENLNVQARAVNTSGKMSDMLVDISSFGFELEGETINGNLRIQDLDRFSWDLAVHGGLDLGKLAAIFPSEDVIMEGVVRADIDSEGSYADVEANRYDRLKTSGEITLRDFYYADMDYPQGIRIREAHTVFSPNAINLSKFDARLGESPVQASGNLSDYMAYLFSESGGVLKGRLDITSTKFNVNEWMTGGEPSSDTTALQVVELPRNIDFTMNVKANEILYDNLVLREAQGSMVLRDGILTFRDFKTKTLGGTLAFGGNYNTQDVLNPTFDMNLNIGDFGVQETFKSFMTVRAFAPIAQHVTGKFSTNFSLSGVLSQDMTPVLSTLDGKGLIRVAEAAVKDSPLLRGITSLSNLNETSTISLRPLSISAEIEDGMLNVRPFDIRLWDYEAKVQGSTGFDGSINYLVSMQVPASKFGSQVNNLVSGLVGTDLSSTMIPLAFNIGGSYNRPNVRLASGDNLDSYLTNALKSRASNVKQKVEQDIASEFKAREDSLKKEVKQRAEVAKDSVRQEAEKLVDQTKEKAVDEVKNILRGFTRNKPKETPQE